MYTRIEIILVIYFIFFLLSKLPSIIKSFQLACINILHLKQREQIDITHDEHIYKILKP